MKIILSPECAYLTGALDSYTGFHIERRPNGFFSKRNQRGHVPPDGRWRFIVICAEQCRRGTHIRDISVGYVELITALHEAGHHQAACCVNLPSYNAEQILQLKSRFGL